MRAHEIQDLISELKSDDEVVFTLSCDRDGYVGTAFVLARDDDPTSATEELFQFEMDPEE